MRVAAGAGAAAILLAACAAQGGAANDEPALAALLVASRRFEVAGQPCVEKPQPRPDWADARHRRQREIRSDSHWLNRYVDERYGDRVAYSGLDASGGRLRHVVALTGTRPVPPMKLGGRAAFIPVVVTYGAPLSKREIARRRAANRLAADRLVPDMQGTAYVHDPQGGYLRMYVYSSDGRPRADVLTRCDALRRAYRLPVLMQFTQGKAWVGPALVQP